MTLQQGIARDAIERGEAGSGADQQQGLVWIAGQIKQFPVGGESCTRSPVCNSWCIHGLTCPLAKRRTCSRSSPSVATLASE